VLTIVFLGAYGIAGGIAFQSIDQDLEQRVEESTELLLARLGDRYESGGEAALIAAVEAVAVDADREDRLVWLGQRSGHRIAGMALPEPMRLASGVVPGSLLDTEPDELYRLGVRDLGHLRLVVATSYEEIGEIREHVLAVFAWATAFILIVAGASAITLARRGQRRIDAIVATMRAVSQGRMTARVPGVGAGDDLGRLSVGINGALEKLEATVDGMRQVTTDIAHDIKTPINRAAILLEQARSASAVDVERTRLLAQAGDEIRRVTATVNALLRIAQIEAGARKSRFTSLSLHRVMRAVYDAYLPVVAANAQTLELGDLPGTEHLVEGDADLLNQLLANLVENSIRHCPAGTLIRLEGGVTGSRKVWMRVSDDGPGIPAGDRTNVLKRFYRVEKSRFTPGTGLGLALVKAIADLHGASLSLGDNEPGLLVELVFPAVDRPGRDNRSRLTKI
jgi:signal transduction histidine kinase